MARSETTEQVLARVRRLADQAERGELPPPVPKGAPIDLRIQAIRMKADGYSYAGIARALDRSENTIHTWVDAALEAIIAPEIGRLRALESIRLDNYLVKLKPRIDRGDDKAINAAIRISERRANLYGLNAPVRVDANINETDQTDLELQDMLNVARAEVAAQEAKLLRGETP